MGNQLLILLILFAWFSGPTVADNGKLHANLRASPRNLQESPSSEPFPPPDHEYIPPSATNGFERSPCPIINTLANHGFINRNGRDIPTSNLASALTELFSVSEEFVTNNEGTGPLDSARTMDLFHYIRDDTTGELIELVDLEDLHKHNRLEHDASFVRQDRAFGGSRPNADPVLVDQLLENLQLDTLTAQDISSAQRRRIRDSRTQNPEFTLEEGSGAGGASVQAALLLVLQQRSELDWVRADTIREFLLFERFPLCYHPDNNWSPGFINHGSNANTTHSHLQGFFRHNIEEEARIVNDPSTPELNDDIFSAYFGAALEEVECSDDNGDLQSCDCFVECGLPQCSCAEARGQSCCDEAATPSNSVELFGTQYDPSTTNMIDLSLNQLTGPIPAEVGSMTALTALYLYDNRLTGHIPPELGLITDMSRLALDTNQLTGPIPLELGRMTALEAIWLYSNALSGPIPSEFGLMSNLDYFDIENNAITGTIPSQLGQLSALNITWLNDNALTGTIPTEFGQLRKMAFLYLHRNSLTGPIPSEFGLLTDLTELNLLGNQLTGPIPSELGLLTGLTELNLLGNPLTGPVPDSLCSLPGLSLSVELTCADELVLVDRRGDW